MIPVSLFFSVARTITANTGSGDNVKRIFFSSKTTVIMTALFRLSLFCLHCNSRSKEWRCNGVGVVYSFLYFKCAWQGYAENETKKSLSEHICTYMELHICVLLRLWPSFYIFIFLYPFSSFFLSFSFQPGYLFWNIKWKEKDRKRITIANCI